MLYIPRQVYGQVLEIVAPIVEGLRHGFGMAVPAFCYTVRPGLGSADDPANGESFGTDRCSLVAQGVVQAIMQKSKRPRMRYVEDAFAHACVDLERPYLNPSTTDVYSDCS